MTGEPIRLETKGFDRVVKHTESEKRSKEIYMLMQNHQVRKSAKNEIIKWINKTYHPNQSKDESLKSTYLTEKLLSESTSLNERRYDMCINGCMMFLRDEELRCFFCLEERYEQSEDESKKSRNTLSQLSIADFVSSYFVNANSRDKILYRARRDATAEAEKLRDYYDGSAYKDAKMKSMFSNEYDIALSLYVDGFHRGQRGKESMTIVKAINMNLAPTERMKKVNQFVNRGVELQTGDLTFSFKVYTSLFLGDIPACADVLFHSGHMSTYGCRVCTIKGASYDSRGIYFTPDETNRHEIRSKENFQEVNLLLPANSETNKGMKRVTPLICFNMFSASFCGLDELHLTGHNLPKQFWRFMQNPNKKYGIDNPLEVSPAIIKALGERFAELQSSSSSRNTRDNVPTRDNRIIEKKVKDTVIAIRCFSSACALALQYEIAVEDLE
ncbi:hypothetical protein BDF21DRAFT_464689 [Thamnidium elegans]|nr:hypothetical protein BDF21DRAFT_464689 [Thamnidium elegans]